MFKKKKTIIESNDQTGPFVEIEIANDYAFVPGTVLEGVVHLNTTVDTHNVDKISIQLLGEEISMVKTKKFEQKITIIDKKFTCYDYKQYDNTIRKGEFGYPFKLHLPYWLPSSHLCYDPEDAVKATEKPGKYSKLSCTRV